MENLEVLVRGVVMQSNPGGLVGLPRSMSFQGFELLWVVAVATIVLAVVSVTRTVSVVSVGWTWGSKPGHVRVRVQSFASLADGAIVTAGGMFDAEILNCSADSCSEDASSSSDCVSERAEMLFIFDEKGASLMTTTTTVPSHPALCAPPAKISRKQPKFQKHEVALVLSPGVCDTGISFPRREGIEWDTLSGCGVGSVLPMWAQALCTPAVYPASPLPSSSSRVVKNTSSACEWDPLLKLSIRDAVVSDGRSTRSSFSRNDFSLPLAPVAVQGGAGAVTLKDDVVRVWDSDSKTLMKSVQLERCVRGSVTAFDVNWESKVAAVARKGGLVSIANLESGVYEECYHTQQPVVQAIHLDSTSSSKTLYTGGPAAANPGCSVSIWDCRSSSRELSMNLSPAITIYGICSHGQELYVREEANSLAAHDLRMLGASPVSRRDIATHQCTATKDRWWDIDSAFEDVDQDDDDDDFFDCLTSEEMQASAASYMGSSFVMAMSRNFSTKQTSH